MKKPLETAHVDVMEGKTSRINKPVFFWSAAGIIAITVWTMIAGENADGVIGAVVEWVSSNFGWYYFAVVTVVIVFVVLVAIRKVGSTKLGPDHAKPQFNMFTWGSMLFAAGIGIDLMFFSVSEPATQYLEPPQGHGGTAEAARQAIVWTLFHYGITGWALYALMGLALGYFAYRHNLPLSLRSALYPLFGKRIFGRWGHVVDIIALLGTVFGIATSLGIGVVQLNYGMGFMFGIPENFTWQLILIVVAVAMATLSVVSGVTKGIRRLSELNVLLALGLMLFILFAGPTQYLLNGLVQNIGDFVARFPSMTLDTMAYDNPQEWKNAWTLFFWAWWVAWAPFVGLFLARISRGRTIRQFVLGTLIVPFVFIALWISIFGNGALDIIFSNEAFGETAMNMPERAFYSMLAEYPGVIVSGAIATFTGLLFYVTSADSGALVMSRFTINTNDPDDDGPKWLRIFWALTTGALTLAMLQVDGVPTLQNATIVMGLPLSFLLLIIMVGLYRALKLEHQRVESFEKALPLLITNGAGAARDGGRSWRQRLARMMSFPGKKNVGGFVDDTVEPALEEVYEELRQNGAQATLTEEMVESVGIRQVELTVTFDPERDFKYQVYPVKYAKPSYTLSREKGTDSYYCLEVFSQDGSHGYDIAGYTKDQIIADVLNQYETHLTFLHMNRETPGNTVIKETSADNVDWMDEFEADREME